MAKGAENRLARAGTNGVTNGAKGREEAISPTRVVVADWARVAQTLGPLRLPIEQLKRFPLTEGSDEEPWDVLLGLLAMDEHQALELLAQRTGLAFVSEPRLQESAGRFYEVVTPDIARQHQDRKSTRL